MEIIIALVDRTLVMMILAPTQGAESSIAMLVLMNVRNKNKLFTKIVIKRLAMPTMGMTTNPKTTSSTTWTRHLIVKPMWMLKTKVIKIHQGVTSGTILAMTKGAEDNLNMIKMRGPTLDNVNNLDKIRNNILNVSQVKLVFTSNANPMLWNMEDEENMYGKLKFNMPKFKGEDDAEAYLSWALKVDKIFRIHNYSGAKKVAMASLEFEDYANTWWEQVVTLREEKGDPPIDTWEDMKEEMEARFVPKHYKTDLFNKLQKLKQGTKTVEEFFKEMELTMMRANIQESENQTIARFFNGLNYPIKRIVEFQQYSNMVELVHQASKAERQVNEDIKYSKSKQYFASKLATSTPTTSVKPTASSTPSKQPSIQSRMKQTVSSTASSKASTGPSNVTCFKCGTQGHKSFECKNTKVMITMENGDIETLSEGEYEALVQAAVANEEDYDEESGEDPLLCTHDPSPSLVVTRVLTTQPQAMEDQRCNIFQTRAGIGGKSIKVIIDGGSCHNLASTELCEKLNLTLRKHPHPYHVQWLSDKGNVKIQHTVTVNFKIGPYEDTVECDVVPMTVCHMLLGRPWKFDKKAIHDGYSNAYTFKVKDKKFELRPMTPSQIIADNAKALARAQHNTHHSELRGEGATHQKESERHHPHMSERKSVLLATKSEWREVKDNPSTTIHYVLICKGLSSETNDLTNIPSSLLSLLKEFQDVFPDELPHGLPPLRGIEHRIDLIPGAPLPNRAATAPTPKIPRRSNAKYKTSSLKGTSTKTQAMETKTLERELETMKMELQRPGRNFRPPGPELPARFLQDAPKMPSSAQEKASDRNFRPEGPELPPGRNFRPSSAQVPKLPLSFRNINYDDGTPRIQAVHLTPSTIASSTSSATVIKCGEGNQLPMTRHQHWIATQAVHAKLNQFEAMLKDTNVRYEERAQVQRIDLNNQVQELNEKIETQGNELKATLAIQGHELLHRRIMIPIKTHATIMWMLKCFNNKLKKRSKHDFDLSKNVYALKKNAFNKNISMLNSKRNNNVFVMIKISFMHVSKKGSAKSKRHVNIKGNLAHLKWPMLKGTTIMPNKK
ncbi:hypothetical protein QYE76_017968 [Lolium multiflorum]|uniref:CCHC-type domain-containing protein n=1 Tax=Lolium multiflorum TaxID=4521 RepID=A0AAD8VCG1_LOLMU|nr:hypothetical protein QYE76_017968 [Lolium multiflorum]